MPRVSVTLSSSDLDLLRGYAESCGLSTASALVFAAMQVLSALRGVSAPPSSGGVVDDVARLRAEARLLEAKNAAARLELRQVGKRVAQRDGDVVVVSSFVSERCGVEPGAEARNRDIYAAFCAWSRDDWSHRRFTQALLARGTGCRVDRKNQRHWIGLLLPG